MKNRPAIIRAAEIPMIKSLGFFISVMFIPIKFWEISIGEESRHELIHHVVK